ncbi:MAG: transglutaminase family protein [Spirochaetes bacterium]|nr:MAG: transglutaminase family protein [Spirochaetota bacterium]
MKEFLDGTQYLDKDEPAIAAFARETAEGARDDAEKAVRLYYAVRDGVRYNPYALSADPATYRASFVLAQKEGYCVQKCILLAAAARAAGVPARVRFATVKNHLATAHLRELMRTDLFVFHGLTEFFLGGRWVKATPAFNLSMCEKFGVLPLEFDGTADSVFHPFDRAGNRHMEYVHDYGPFADFPFEYMMEEYRKYYPHFFEAGAIEAARRGDFEREAGGG